MHKPSKPMKRPGSDARWKCLEPGCGFSTENLYSSFCHGRDTGHRGDVVGADGLPLMHPQYVPPPRQVPERITLEYLEDHHRDTLQLVESIRERLVRYSELVGVAALTGDERDDLNNAGSDLSEALRTVERRASDLAATISGLARRRARAAGQSGGSRG